MERKKALATFQEAASLKVQFYREQMRDHLLRKSVQLEERIKEGIKQLGKQMEEKGKEYVSFFYISILKTDLIQRKYRFYLHAMNQQWYLDDEPLEVYIEAKEFLEPLDSLWEELKEESKSYQSFIHPYDIWHIVFDELKVMDASIAQILRYRLRDWEKKEVFTSITLSPYWFLKWGEYRDQTEFILNTDRIPKEETFWKEELRKARHKVETLIFSYWYQGNYQKDKLEKLDMRFSVFEECSLEHVVFHNCNMEGSRFTRSKLSGCDFEGCNLMGADFSDCSLEGVSFQNAKLEGALFLAEKVPFLNLDSDQIQVILLKREET